MKPETIEDWAFNCAMKKNKTAKGMMGGGISSVPFGSGPTKLRNRNPDPRLPRGKKGKGDI